MNNHKNKAWDMIAKTVCAITTLISVIAIVMMAQLNMFPLKYLVAVILVVVFLLLLIGALCFFLPFGKKKIKRLVYTYRALGVTLAFALVMLSGVGISMISQLQNTMSSVIHDGPPEIDTEPDSMVEEFSITEDPFIVYISGTDTRGTGLTKVRSDVNILAVVNPATKQVLLINTPRDYYVSVAGYPEGTMDKLAHVGVHGIEYSARTLEKLYEHDVKYYVRVNFIGFTKLIDAIGGVTVTSEKGFYTSENGYWISKGKNYLNGAQALDFVRDRSAFADGDFARGRHQMDVINSVIEKLASGVALTNYAEVLNSVEGYFYLSLSGTEISELVKMQLDDLASWNVKTYSVTGEGKKRTTYSSPDQKSYVILPDVASLRHAEELIDMVFDGKILNDEDLVLSE